LLLRPRTIRVQQLHRQRLRAAVGVERFEAVAELVLQDAGGQAELRALRIDGASTRGAHELRAAGRRDLRT